MNKDDLIKYEYYEWFNDEWVEPNEDEFIY